jgi:hypothetical protein
MGEGRGVNMVLVGRPESKTPLGRPTRRWEDNIKRGDRDRWGDLDSTGSAYGIVAGFCENGNEPSESIKKAGYFLTD